MLLGSNCLQPPLPTSPPPPWCSSLLRSFESEALLGSSYFFCRQDAVVEAAALLDPVRCTGQALRCWMREEGWAG